ncbi:DNA adenine methylase [Pseudomonas shirazica]|uniref:DNA adenine methylase n=1 Tax=Pseudomonas TaxID=286 RepID=UPI003852C601
MKQRNRLSDLKGPLRYPGSKAAFAPVFFEILRQMGVEFSEIVEPYSGSAAISLYALNTDLCERAVLIERDPLVFAFWYSVFNETEALLESIRTIEVNMDTWHRLQPLRDLQDPDMDRVVELGFAGLFFNRANYSGMIGAKPIGGLSQSSNYKIDCRFNRDDLVKKVLHLSRLSSRVDVIFGDALSWISKQVYSADRIYYVDPPYFDQGKKLYRHFYNVADHIDLYEVLESLENTWFLSYDKHHVIEKLYEEFNFISMDFRYSSRMPKLGSELLITNCQNGALNDLGQTWTIESLEKSTRLVEVARKEVFS